MRIKHFFGLAVIAAMTASCSSNNDLVNGGNGSGENESGVGYASFKINLPTTGGTRATAGDPEFNGGDANEYAVNDATLLLFKKVTEDGKVVYKFQEVVELGNMEPWTKKDPENGGITTTAKMTAKLTNASVGSTDYYALILLNNNYDTGTSTAKIKYPTKNQTFSDWSKNADNATANYLKYDKGFFMANAPKYVAGAPETLVAIKNIYASKQEAENSAATTVYVERGLAKVSLATDSENKHVDIKSGNYAGDKVDIKGWTLDVTNTKTYPVHVTEGLWADTWKATVTPAATNGATMDRFHDTKLTEFPRVYWGLDPNYSTNFADVAACEGEFNLVANQKDLSKAFKTDEEAKKPQYCLENTFDIDHMVQGQTTRVLFSAKYQPNGFKPGETFYKMGNSSQLWNASKVEAQIKAKAMEVLSEADADKVEVILTGTDLAKAGIHLITKANVKHGTTEISDEDITAINTKLGFKAASGTDPMVGLSTYVDGVSYYIARVKHFGDDLTKWEAGNATYASNNANWLGRYGVLRNNWYELSVRSVSGPGYPDVPKVNPTAPDDENEQYINVEVKILDWAKRSQNVDL